MIVVNAIVVKVRDGQVRTTPLFHVVMGVTVNRGNPASSGSGPTTVRRVRGSGREVFSEVKNRGGQDGSHRGLRRPQRGGCPEVITTTVGADGGPAVHRVSDLQQLPVCRAVAPRRDRAFAHARLHSPERGCGEGPVRRVRRRVG